MELDHTIIKLIGALTLVDTINPYISAHKKEVVINDFISIAQYKICINTFDVSQKILSQSNNKSNTVDVWSFQNFIHQNSKNIIRLNHLGVSYWCKNIEEEIESYKKNIKNTSLHIYEEKSGIPQNRWFFIGNAAKWQSPFFEISLNQNPKYYEDKWIPHFQIDLDTSFSYNELKNIVNKCFGNNFINWSLDYPKIGTILVMGSLGTICGTKIYIGLGAKQRNTPNQRKVLFKEIM